MKEYDKAEKLAANSLLSTNLETMNHRVRLASFLQLPVEELLYRMDNMLDTQVKMMAAQVDGYYRGRNLFVKPGQENERSRDVPGI